MGVKGAVVLRLVFVILGPLPAVVVDAQNCSLEVFKC